MMETPRLKEEVHGGRYAIPIDVFPHEKPTNYLGINCYVAPVIPCQHDHYKNRSTPNVRIRIHERILILSYDVTE